VTCHATRDHGTYKTKQMEKILISVDESGYRMKLNKIKSCSIELNKLLEAFLKLQIIADDGINLELLLYNSNYINELLSKRKDIKKLNFKNISELHKLFLDQDKYNAFENERIRVSQIFKKEHIPLNYYNVEQGFINLDNEQLEITKEGFKNYAETIAEITAFKKLQKVCEAINEFNNSLNVHSSSKLVTPRGLNVRFARFIDEQLTPTIQGVKLASQCIASNNGYRVKQPTH